MAVEEARQLEVDRQKTERGVDLAALLGHRPARLVSPHAHTEWVKALGIWGVRPLLVIAENSLRRVSSFVDDPEQARMVAELSPFLERRLAGEPLPEEFVARATSFLERDEVQNYYAMVVAKWALELAKAESLYGAATYEQVGYAQGCVQFTADLERRHASSEVAAALGDFLWNGLVWSNLEECQPRIVAAMLRVPSSE